MNLEDQIKFSFESKYGVNLQSNKCPEILHHFSLNNIKQFIAIFLLLNVLNATFICPDLADAGEKNYGFFDFDSLHELAFVEPEKHSLTESIIYIVFGFCAHDINDSGDENDEIIKNGSRNPLIRSNIFLTFIQDITSVFVPFKVTLSFESERTTKAGLFRQQIDLLQIFRYTLG